MVVYDTFILAIHTGTCRYWIPFMYMIHTGRYKMHVQYVQSKTVSIIYIIYILW
jgi:hypothetical protein